MPTGFFHYGVGSDYKLKKGSYRVGLGSGRSVEIYDRVFPGISFIFGYFRVFRVFPGILGIFGYIWVYPYIPLYQGYFLTLMMA